jgi:hypothetical protein
MLYIECPQRLLEIKNALFLAGGISGCADWQSEMVELLRDTNYTILNPRRRDFPAGDPAAARTQIIWEYDHLRMAEKILFWFSPETLNPIVLYELGAWSMTDKPLFVGVHPQYKRRQDVEIQTALVRPDISIVYSLAELAQQIKMHSTPRTVNL